MIDAITEKCQGTVKVKGRSSKLLNSGGGGVIHEDFLF